MSIKNGSCESFTPKNKNMEGNYKTAEAVTDTLQDSLKEQIKLQTKVDINDLKNDVLKDIQTVKVKLKDPSSYLRVRNLNTSNNDIVARALFGHTLTVLSDHRFIDEDGEKKLYIHVKGSCGEGWVSADYVEAEEKLISPTHRVITNPESDDKIEGNEVNESLELTKEKNVLAASAMKIKDNTKRAETLDKINNCTNLKECKTIEEEIKKIIESEVILSETPLELLLKGLQIRTEEFKDIAQKTEDLENVLGVVWGQEEQLSKQKVSLASKYEEILIIISELNKTDTPEVKLALEGTYLFLAEYYSSNHEKHDNDHMRDYNISTIMALGVIKDIDNCPNFPNLSELQAKFPNEEDFQRELELSLSAFDERFEDFADKIKDSSDQRAKKAIEIIEDNRGIGYFDFAEDITDSLFHGAGGAGAIIIGTAAVILSAPGWIVGGAIAGGSALVGASINTIARGETEGLAQLAGETGILALQVGAAGLIGRTSIRLLSSTTSRLAVAGILTAEMAGDVAAVGMLGDYLTTRLHGSEFDGYNSFKENLIWAPLVLLGGGGKLLRGNLERAKVKHAVGDTKGVADELDQFNSKVEIAKKDLIGKEIDVEYKGDKLTTKIEEDGRIKIIDSNGERYLDPKNVDDQEISELISKKIHIKADASSDSNKIQEEEITQKSKSETTLSETESFNFGASFDSKSVEIKDGIPYYKNKRVKLPSNKSFYIENIDGRLYRLETGKGGSIKKVFSVEQTKRQKKVDKDAGKSPYDNGVEENKFNEVKGRILTKEMQVSGAGQTSFIRYNLKEIHEQIHTGKRANADSEIPKKSSKSETKTIDSSSTVSETGKNEVYIHLKSGEEYTKVGPKKYKNSKGKIIYTLKEDNLKLKKETKVDNTDTGKSNQNKNSEQTNNSDKQSNTNKDSESNPDQVKQTKSKIEEKPNKDIDIDAKTGKITIDKESINVIENKSFYIEGSDSELYRVSVGKKGKITDVYSMSKNQGKKIEDIGEVKLSKSEKEEFITNNTDSIKENVRSLINKTELKAFENQFMKALDKESVTINDIKYTKRTDGKYNKAGDQRIYSRDEMLEKISPKDKKAFIEKQAKSIKEGLKDGESQNLKVKRLENGNFVYGKYNISNKEVTVTENGKTKVLTDAEETVFYQKNGAELLNKIRGFDLAKKADKFKDLFKSESFKKNFEKVAKENGFIDKQATNIGNLIKSQLNPLRLVEEFKQAKGTKQVIKTLFFGSKDISKTNILVQQSLIFGYSVREALSEDAWNDNADSGDNIGLDFVENYLIFTHFSFLYASMYEAWED